jgi:transcriptional regulator with XRE-family HTH domain
MEYNTTMTTADSILKRLLRASGFSQRELGRRARTSNASLVAYAKGRQDPGLATLQRLADAASCDLIIEVRPRLTAPELRTLELHRLIVEKLEENPDRVLAFAKRNLELMRCTDHGGHSQPYLDAWQMLVEGPRRNLARVMVSTDAAARDLRQASPFSGVLSDEERIDALLRTDGERVAAKSGRSLDDIRLELLDKSASSARTARDDELAGA